MKPATGFVLNETAYPVTISEHEQLIEIEFENRFIRGTVQTTKVDAQYPENKLTGAVFEIYVDVDGNKQFDADIDMLVGELTEVDEGIYHMEDLRYNGYFLHEKTAPEGYLIDTTPYAFEIKENGQIIKAEMTNEKVPEPEAPKTGDNSMTGFWIGLGAVALGGLISLGIIRKKNGGDDE